MKSAASFIFSAAVLAASTCAGPARAAAAPPPVAIESFFRHPAIAEAKLSPSARLVAVVAANKDDVEQLVVLDAHTRKPLAAIGWKYQSVSNVHWVSERRLVYQLTLWCPADCPSDYSLEAGRPGWYAVDVDGSNARRLTGYRYVQSFEDRETDEIVASSTGSLVRTRWSVKPYLKAWVLDTRTGEPVLRETGRQPVDMLVDKNGEPRFVTTHADDTHALVEYRPGAKAPWEPLARMDLVTGAGLFDVVGFSERTAYVVARPEGAGFNALYTYDLQERRLSAKPLVNAPGFDIEPTVIVRAGKVLGVRFETDAETTVWFDAAARKVQQQVDALLPGTINRIEFPARPATPLVLVSSYSDTEPGAWFLFDTQAGSIVPLGRSRSDIDPARMARRDFVRYQARDGREIPGWITTPRTGGGAWPAVVLVHGGPWLRGGHWHWEAQTQFLASRGYVVLEPEFRGSAGFGAEHFRAGWKQWGLAMQDDVADMARWAIAKGLVDPKRICIAGGSYGGYSAVMGLVRDPDLYRCGIDLAGPTDFAMMDDELAWSSDSADVWRKYGMPVLVADVVKDAKQVQATSPLQQAARVKAPLLLAYGQLDPIVPIEQGERFKDAVMKTNPDVQWVPYEHEGHGFRLIPDEVDFWRRVERLLDRTIGSAGH